MADSDPSKPVRAMSSDDFDEYCGLVRAWCATDNEASRRFLDLHDQLESKGTVGLTPAQLDAYHANAVAVARGVTKVDKPAGARLTALLEKLQTKGAKIRRRPTTPFDDELLKLTTMVCVRCGGAIRLDMIAKAVYAKFAWRKHTQVPEKWIASDLGLCIETVADATRRLECCGLLAVRRNRGKQRWNEYALTPLEAVRGISMSKSLHRVFAEGEDPNDIYMDAKPAPCRCLPAVHRSRKKNPVPPDAVHPVPPDAVHPVPPDASIRYRPMHDPKPPDARPDTARCHDQITDKQITDEQSKEEQPTPKATLSAGGGSLSQTPAVGEGFLGTRSSMWCPGDPIDDNDDGSPRSNPVPPSPTTSNPPMAGEPNHRAVHPVPPDAREVASSTSENARANARSMGSNSAETVRPIPPRKPLPPPDSGYNDDGTTFGAVPPAALTAQQVEEARRAESKARYQRRKASAAEAKRISEMPW